MDVQAEIIAQYKLFGWILVLGVALFLLKIILSIALKGRLAPGLAPDLSDLHQPGFFTRVLALLGHRARVPETMGRVRLRTTAGLQLAYWGGAAALTYYAVQMDAPAIGLETLIIALVLLAALQSSFYEITYDRETVTLPRWWFGRTTRKWSDLLAVSTRDAWMMSFSFEGGMVIRVHKYIVGYDRLMDTAQKAMRAG